MSTPSEAQVITMFKDVVKLYEETRQFAEVNATDNWVALEDALVQALITDFPVEILEPIAASRTRLDGLLRDAASAMSPVIRQWAYTVGITETDPLAILIRLFRRFVDVTAARITSRQFTFGTPTAKTANVGNGTILRLNKDRDNFDIENQHSDAKDAKCVADMNTGAIKHEELFEFRGAAPPRDALRVSGSGAVANIAAYSARDSVLLNPSFSQYSGTLAVPTAINNWTPLSGVFTAYEISETYYFRDFLGDTTPRSLIIKGNDTLYQKLSTNNLKLSPDVPYLLRLAINRNLTTASQCNTGTTLQVTLGGKSRTIQLNTGSGWVEYNIPSTIGQDCWPPRFNEDDLSIDLVSAGVSGAERIGVDDVKLVPGVPFDGSWYWVFGGSTRFLFDDEFTWTDSEVGAVLQRWLHRAFGVYLPHSTGGGITISDP